MTDKTYLLLPIENGYVAIDPDKVAKYGEYSVSSTGVPQQVRDKPVLWQEGCHPIIAHTGIPSLKDSGLPLIEILDIVHQMALKTYPQLENLPEQSPADIEKQVSKRIGWEEGYKAAGGYTEEDIMNFYKYVKTHTYEEAITHMKALKNKHPKAIVLEMTTYCDGTTIEEDMDCPCHKLEGNVCIYGKPKIVEGKVIVKEVPYD